MKRLLGIIALVVLLIAPIMVSGVSAQVAYTEDWTSSITYQNLSGSQATIDFNFYENATDDNPFTLREELAGNAGDSIFIGAVEGVDSGFQGSVVMTADQPVIATMVQIAVGSTVINRPLANGFTEGANTILLASVLKNQFNQSTRFAVQNAGSSSVNVTVNYIPVPGSAGSAAQDSVNNLAPGAVQYFDPGSLAALGDQFNGSATITADGPIVAAALELGTDGLPNYANSFESVTQGSNTIYMPSALCNAFGSAQETFYAIQNTSDSDSATVTATYEGGDTDTQTIPPGEKRSFFGCTAGQGTGDPINQVDGGYSGSSVLTSNGAPVVAIGKVSSSGGSGITSSFLGFSEGASRISLPYVRWALDSEFAGGNAQRGQRAFIAIQNVGSSTVSGAVVRYIDPTGTVVATHNLLDIPAGGKVNSLAGGEGDAGPDLDHFGYGENAQGAIGGGAVIEGPSGSQLVAVVRIASTDVGRGGFLVGEDYNGIPSE